MKYVFKPNNRKEVAFCNGGCSCNGSGNCNCKNNGGKSYQDTTKVNVK